MVGCLRKYILLKELKEAGYDLDGSKLLSSLCQSLKVKNSLRQKFDSDKQQHIAQLKKALDKANAIIQGLAQVRLLEFKKTEMLYALPLVQERDNSTVATVEKKRKQ